ncbi:NADH-quinone oxidoreductase subunit H [Candidatus Micrarchaeota archaeon]|nr:NADH-quinone oxidoreductase subunit H [Candidatus Micrarchaeota archaeon]
MAVLAQVALVFALAPLVAGLARKIKARFQSRRGAPLLQPYADLAKLLRKKPVQSTASSWVFTLAPFASFASVVAAAALLPLLSAGVVPASDLVVFFYLFAISRFVTALAGLDVASAFGGLGASRELLFSAIIEPALFALALFLATFDSGVNLGALFWQVPNLPGALLSPAHWLAAAALFILVLAELGRLPFDNPATHLELTMVHEAMILDYSGPFLALIEWAQAAKTVLLLSLLSGLFLPIFSSGMGAGLTVILWVAGVLSLTVLVAVVESLTPKRRLFKAPELVMFAWVLALTAFLARGSDLAQSGGAWMLAFAMLVCNVYFLFSATFRRRLEIYLVQSVALALILAQAALEHGSADAYIRLASTLVFKVVLVPWLLYKAFLTVAGESKVFLNADPLYFKSPIGTTGALVAAGFLILLSFLMAPFLGAQSLMLPVAIAVILTGGLVISSKSHVLLQLMGFLLLENGLVLLPLALSLELPLVGEATALFDALTLIVVALVLVFKISTVIDSLDSGKFDELTEGK